MTADFAQPALNRLIERHLPRTFPAISACVIHQGDPILHLARGFIDPDTRQHQISTQSLFDLASVSKLITETSFLVLVDAGKVSLDTPLADIVPEFAKINPRPIGGGQDPHTRDFFPPDEAYRGASVNPAHVTCKHLLTHSSGLPPWRSVYLLAADHPPPPPAPDQTYATERWRKGLSAMVGFPFAGPIGDTVRYTDIGIMLLGEAVARLQACRLDQAVRELVLQPLSLSSFTYSPEVNGIPRTNIVPTELDDHWRYRRAWGEVHDENACGVGGIAGHAGLFATAADVARFGQAWLSRDSRLQISPELRASATRQHASGQYRLGLGWMLKATADSSAGDLYSPDSYGHTGFTGTSLWIDPHRQLVCALLTNRVFHGRDPDGIHAFRRAFHDIIVQAVDAR